MAIEPPGNPAPDRNHKIAPVMPHPPITRMTADQLPRVKQNVKLECGRCHHAAVHDVGTIFCEPGDSGSSETCGYAFSSYFRCPECGSGGPWKLIDLLKLAGLSLRVALHRQLPGVVMGEWQLFDGTRVQTPALAKDHLRALIEKEPANAFLRTRLGNVFRGCHQPARSVPCYEQALRLDPGDVEARHHLFNFALESNDVPAQVTHGVLLVRHFLAGRHTNSDELTEGLAYFLVEKLRHAPELVRERFLASPELPPADPAGRFIRSLLEQKGDEQSILADATQRLLRGQALPAPSAPATSAAHPPEDREFELIPSLREVIDAKGLDAENLTVPLQADGQGNIRVENRSTVPIFDGKKAASWTAPSLRALFRGSQTPPSDMDHYPPQYAPIFYFLENHVVTVCAARGDRTDHEMEQIYSTLRRRPDGRSLGEVHDFLWQVAALMLGRHRLSEAEFDAILGQLARSARKWAEGPTSRNYVEFLRQSFASFEAGQPDLTEWDDRFKG